MSEKIGALLLIFLVAGTFARASDIASPLPVYRTLAYYEVRPVSGEPQAAGRLSNAEWKRIPSADTFYIYLKQTPVQGELQTSFQMAYDEEGLYLRIVNTEPRMEAIIAKKLTRGDPELWKDDCVQLYFDPTCSGTGYLNFTINSLGTQSDRKQLDGSVSLDEWRGENWRTWITKEKESWVIEAFFPWPDLEAKAMPGDVWMFNPVRFGYSTGAFKGVSWALGGSYLSPGNFGYLYFGEERPTTAEDAARVLSQKATAPWNLMMEGKIIHLSNGGGPPRIAKASQVLGELRERARKLRMEIEKLPGSKPEMLHDLATPKPDSASSTVEQAIEEESSILRKLLKVYWTEKTRLLTEHNSAT